METIIVCLRKDFVAVMSQRVRLCSPFSSVRFLAHSDECAMVRIEGEREMRCIEWCAPILHCLKMLRADWAGRDTLQSVSCLVCFRRWLQCCDRIAQVHT